MAVIRYILDRSAYDNPSRWNPAELRGPLLSDLLHRYRAHHVPIENEQVLHFIYKAHHIHGALTDLSIVSAAQMRFSGLEEETLYR